MLRALGWRRLEEHEDVTGMQALEQFDSRLVGAVRKLQELGKWEAVVARGGSSPQGLSLGTSKYDAEVGRHGRTCAHCRDARMGLGHAVLTAADLRLRGPLLGPSTHRLLYCASLASQMGGSVVPVCQILMNEKPEL